MKMHLHQFLALAIATAPCCGAPPFEVHGSSSSPCNEEMVTDDSDRSQPKLLRISGQFDGSGKFVFTRETVRYVHKHWARPSDVLFDGEAWTQLERTPAPWRDYGDRLDLTKAWVAKREGRDVVALEHTAEGFDLYIADSPNGAAKYAVTVAIPRTSSRWHPSHAQEPALDFLSKIPELRDLSLKMTEKQLKAHIDKHKLYFRMTTSKDGTRNYWVVTAEGENVFVGFDGEGCLGIQRMSPIPKKLIAGAIGVPAFEEWIAKQKAEQAHAAALSSAGAAALPPREPLHGPVHRYYREWRGIAALLTNESTDIVLLFPVPPPPVEPWYEFALLPRPSGTFFHFNPGYKF